MDYGPPSSSFHRIIQARILEWVAISFSRDKYEVSEMSEVKSLSRVQLFVILWTVAYQAPPSMGFSKQEYTGMGCHFLLQTLTIQPSNCAPQYLLKGVKHLLFSC